MIHKVQASQPSQSEVMPTFFPMTSNVVSAAPSSNDDNEAEPSFVTPLAKNKSEACAA